MSDIRFVTSKPLTLGVELELQIVDNRTMDLVQVAPDILATVPRSYQQRIKAEFIRSMIELNTDICESVDAAADNLADIYQVAERLAKRQNTLLFASSLHPLALSADQRLSDNSRYKKILNDLQMVGRRFITQGLHVHVGMPDGESCIRVCDAMRLYLPLLLALTTSSPYYEGVDTGLCSYRAKLFEALPLAGIPDRLGDWSHFVSVVRLLVVSRIINSVRDLWWDVRPHPDFGTVEIRICDLPSRFDEILAVVALVQSLAAHFLDSQESIHCNMQVLRSNKWQAARYGLDGAFVNPRSMETSTIKTAISALLQRITVSAASLGTTPHFSTIHRIIANGTSAAHQRRIVDKTGDLRQILFQMGPAFFP